MKFELNDRVVFNRTYPMITGRVGTVTARPFNEAIGKYTVRLDWIPQPCAHQSCSVDVEAGAMEIIPLETLAWM